MDKQKVIHEITRYLAEEKADADPVRQREIDGLLLMYRFLPTREYGPEEVIIPSVLVELEHGGQITYCLIVPHGGGLIMRVDGFPVQVVTPQSPLGEALLGRHVGETISITVRDEIREYRILGIS